jgi:hypothetical protein
MESINKSSSWISRLHTCKADSRTSRSKDANHSINAQDHGKSDSISSKLIHGRRHGLTLPAKTPLSRRRCFNRIDTILTPLHQQHTASNKDPLDPAELACWTNSTNSALEAEDEHRSIASDWTKFKPRRRR